MNTINTYTNKNVTEAEFQIALNDYIDYTNEEEPGACSVFMDGYVDRRAFNTRILKIKSAFAISWRREELVDGLYFAFGLTEGYLVLTLATNIISKFF